MIFDVVMVIVYLVVCIALFTSVKDIKNSKMRSNLLVLGGFLLLFNGLGKLVDAQNSIKDFLSDEDEAFIYVGKIIDYANYQQVFTDIGEFKYFGKHYEEIEIETNERYYITFNEETRDIINLETGEDYKIRQIELQESKY